MNPWLLAGLVAVVAVVVVVKRLAGEPLNARDLFAAPLVLTGIGVWALVKGAHGLGGADYAWVAAGSVLGVALGAARGLTVHVFEKEGVLWQRYTGRTFAVLVVSALISIGFAALASRMGMHPQARPVQLSIGVGFLGEALAVGARGLGSGVPFAPERKR
ncbi:DUF1453 domain-containing protein [Streptomyces griseocarneus]|uniref:DUF1453 domain-containing protein n=1 Tax=Streptomyces griseocarneus TaxID=51201 RepID=UPI00167ED1CF|nr:DUF1453 domain-containing protein [Streptomyces griseocarneus]MBZ6472672.1 DUF1453 domain-containing protein [Streptomyces griseocarneus]GHG46644.1 hypothetical protein GCM10018779_03300 [Streptomyces griseocarneus]